MNIKEKLYEIIKGLGYPVSDNAADRSDNVFPFLLLRTNTTIENRVNGLIETVYDFKVDVFSKYSGEKEIYEINTKISAQVASLYEDPSIILAKNLGLFILEDRSTGIVLKHGVINIIISRVVKEAQA